MAQTAEDEKEKAENHVWPKSLLLNQAYALTFQCISCNEIPKRCMNNEDGDVLCYQCSKQTNNVTENKPIQKMINKLKTRCLTIHKYKQQNDSDNSNVEGMNVIATQIKDNECDWTGSIKEWDEHSKECQYLLIQCNECKAYECARKLMNNHVSECPEV
eukprot:438176_1